MPDLSILLTEDDSDVARYLTTVLKSLGHKVVAVASDGMQAVKLARELKPKLVIMDIDLPGMNGIVAAGKILEEQSVPIIISTGRTDTEALESTKELNIQAFLVKPFSAVQLKSAIAVAVCQHRMQNQARQKITELSGALEAVQDKADVGPFTQPRLQAVGLTKREAEVMVWVAQGKSNSDIATILESSPRTVAKHIEHIFGKLNVESRTAAVAEARRLLQDIVATEPS
ncbi:MAG: DNA-binding response regulator [Verrucomicrobia bacterium]|nr:DNA-binding response regulator [Verrucomicrobiota bacterium]